jgi:hypothetical protein
MLMTALSALAALSGCGPSSGDDAPDAAPCDGGRAALALPPEDAGFDYQLGGAYPPPDGVGIVGRDRNAPPAADLYSICYVNGFQIQPDEEDVWTRDHPDLILRDGAGEPIEDEEWDEMLIDVGTPDKRVQVAGIVGGWIAGCAACGFDAVEIDNLDSFTRSKGRLDEEDAVETMRLFAAAAHDAELAIAQKNSAELVPRRADMDTDFAVVEECNTYAECDAYTAGYGGGVLVVEYVREDFETGCALYPELSIVLRDRDLVAPPDPAYVFDDC